MDNNICMGMMSGNMERWYELDFDDNLKTWRTTDEYKQQTTDRHMETIQPGK